jgi:hypothetical protein
VTTSDLSLAEQTSVHIDAVIVSITNVSGSDGYTNSTGYLPDY